MELVVKIPDEWYEYVKNNQFLDINGDVLADILSKGTILPENHGRLIDADANKCTHCGKYGCADADLCTLYNSPTILKASTNLSSLSVVERMKLNIADAVKQDIKAHTASGLFGGL